MTNNERLIEEILAAFPHLRPAYQVDLAENPVREEPAKLQAEFLDLVDWTTIGSEQLDTAPDGYGSALSFLTPAAARFYIPAFMRADVLDGLNYVTPSVALANGFDNQTWRQPIGGTADGTWTERAQERWGALTSAQVAVIVRYLEFVVQRDGVGVSAAVLEALSRYWLPRQEGRSPD